MHNFQILLTKRPDLQAGKNTLSPFPPCQCCFRNGEVGLEN